MPKYPELVINSVFVHKSQLDFTKNSSQIKNLQISNNENKESGKFHPYYF